MIHKFRCRRITSVCALVVVFFAGAEFALSQMPNVEVKLSDGQTRIAPVQSFGLDDVTLSAEAGTERVRFEDIAQIVFRSVPIATSPSTCVATLIDGSTLKLSEIRFGERDAELSSADTFQATVGLRNLSLVQFDRFENSPEFAQQFRELQNEDSISGDAIVVERKGELTTVEGVVGELDADKLEFSIGDRTARVALDKIKAIMFYRASGRELPRALGELKLLDGTALRVKRIALADDLLLCTLVCGEELTFPFDVIGELDLAAERATFLSDLQPSTNDWQPLLASSSIANMLRRLKLAKLNQTFNGQPLTLKLVPNSETPYASKLKVFEHGIAINGGGKIAFRLNRQYKSLSGVIGFRPQADANGNVLFRIMVDNRVAFEQNLVHKEMLQPVELNLELNDADRVVFEVDYHDSRSVGDELHLVDLKVKK